MTENQKIFPSEAFLGGLLTVLVYALVFAYNITPVHNYDFWWHLAAGRSMFQGLTVYFLDIFSFTCQGNTWINTYWLFEALLYIVYLAGGIIGIIFAKSVVVALSLYLQERWLAKAGVGWLWSKLAVVVILLTGHWCERANLITFFFLSLLFYYFERLRRSGKMPGFLVCPLIFLVWANMHRGFLIGLAVAGAYVAFGSITQKRGYGRSLLLLLICGIVTLLNPYGAGLYKGIWADFSFSPEYIEGWARTPFAGQIMFWVLMAAFAAVVLAQILKRDFKYADRIAVGILFSVGSVCYSFFVSYFFLFAVPFMAVSLNSFSERFKFEELLRKRALVAKIAMSAVVMVVFVSMPVKTVGIEQVFPERACDFMEKIDIRGPFYNEYRFGGYLMWRFAGKHPVFIDGRCPMVEGYGELVKSINKAKRGPSGGWENFLGLYGVRGALMDYPKSRDGSSIFKSYFPRERWALVYWDDICMLFLRRGVGNDGIIDLNEFKNLFPDASPEKFMEMFNSVDESTKLMIIDDIIRNGSIHPESRRVRDFVRSIKSIEKKKPE